MMSLEKQKDGSFKLNAFIGGEWITLVVGTICDIENWIVREKEKAV